MSAGVGAGVGTVLWLCGRAWRAVVPLPDRAVGRGVVLGAVPGWPGGRLP
jgi:hypothetical protein